MTITKRSREGSSQEEVDVKKPKKEGDKLGNGNRLAGVRAAGNKKPRYSIPELLQLVGMGEWKRSGDFEWARKVKLDTFYSKNWARYHEPIVREFVKNIQKDGLSSVVRGIPVVVSKGLVMEVFGLPGKSDKDVVLKAELASEAHRSAVGHMVPWEALKKDEGYLIDKAHGAYKLRLRGLNESFNMKKKTFLMAGGTIQALAYAETMNVDMATMFLSNLKREFSYLRAKSVSGTFVAPAITMLVMRCIPWIQEDYVLMQVANPVHGRDLPCQVNMMPTEERDSAPPTVSGNSDQVEVVQPVTQRLRKSKANNNNLECGVGEELKKLTSSAATRRYDLRNPNPEMPSSTTELDVVADLGVKNPELKKPQSKKRDRMVQLMSLESSILKLHSYLPDIAVARNTMKENDDLRRQVANMTTKLSVQVEKILSDHKKQKSEWEEVALNLERQLRVAKLKQRETRKKYEKIIAAKEKKIARLGGKIIDDNFRLENYDKLLISSLSTIAESNLFQEYILKKSNPQLEYLKAALDEDIQKKCRYYVDEIEGLQNKLLDLTDENCQLKELQQVKTNQASEIERPTGVLGDQQGIKTIHEKVDLKTCELQFGSNDKLTLLALSTMGLGARWEG
ncbi:hypothetical protein BDL97_15G024000 [Sphagnum fallax]|nr:hypothetical protein BDL97_15G024000 [Sphagnum fallax]KAH8939169.1 hypothetical protein BDL97_15G024000 [Sphagnum fallax]